MGDNVVWPAFVYRIKIKNNDEAGMTIDNNSKLVFEWLP